VIKLKNILILCLISFLACDNVKLNRASAQDILAAAQEEKGKKAVLINVWATW
jgi:hypothetical protein